MKLKGIKFKSSTDRAIEKIIKRSEAKAGRRVMNEEEIRRALYIKGKVLVDDCAERLKTFLPWIAVSGIAGIIFPPLMEIPIAFCFFLVILLWRYIKYSDKLRAFQKRGEYKGVELKHAGTSRGITALSCHEKNTYLTISCGDFKPSKQKAMLYASNVPAVMVAIIDEDGTGFWYDPLEEEDEG